MKSLYFAAVALSLAPICLAQTAIPEPVRMYMVDAAIVALTCELRTKRYISSENAALIDSVFACPERARVELTNNFKEVVGLVKGKPLEAFKEFYISQLAYLNTLKPNNESERGFAQRAIAASRKTEEMWSRFELEMQMATEP